MKLWLVGKDLLIITLNNSHSCMLYFWAITYINNYKFKNKFNNFLCNQIISAYRYLCLYVHQSFHELEKVQFVQRLVNSKPWFTHCFEEKIKRQLKSSRKLELLTGYSIQLIYITTQKTFWEVLVPQVQLWCCIVQTLSNSFISFKAS